MMTNELILITPIVFLIYSIFAGIGVGSGLMLTLTLSFWLDPQEFIPIVGIVGSTSSVLRFIFFREYLLKEVVVFFFIGAILSTPILLIIYEQSSKSAFKVVIGFFVLALIHFPTRAFNFLNNRWLATGCISTISSFIAGGGGPLSAAVLSKKEVRPEQFTVTMATLGLVSGVFKGGFLLATPEPIENLVFTVTVLSTVAVLGTALSMVWVKKISQSFMALLVKIAVTGLAVRMIFQGL